MAEIYQEIWIWYIAECCGHAPKRYRKSCSTGITCQKLGCRSICRSGIQKRPIFQLKARKCSQFSTTFILHHYFFRSKCCLAIWKMFYFIPIGHDEDKSQKVKTTLTCICFSLRSFYIILANQKWTVFFVHFNFWINVEIRSSAKISQNWNRCFNNGSTFLLHKTQC